MQASDVLELLKLLEQQGMNVVVDGGWGVAALLGRRTRLHGDLDIAIEHKDVSKLRVVKFHTQYEPDEDDFKDVHAVCAKFSVPMPANYVR